MPWWCFFVQQLLRQLLMTKLVVYSTAAAALRHWIAAGTTSLVLPDELGKGIDGVLVPQWIRMRFSPRAGSRYTMVGDALAII